MSNDDQDITLTMTKSTAGKSEKLHVVELTRWQASLHLVKEESEEQPRKIRNYAKYGFRINRVRV